MEKDFPISSYPLEQSEFLYDSKLGKRLRKKLSSMGFDLLQWAAPKNRKKARDKFKGKKNTEFDYSMFHYRLGSYADNHPAPSETKSRNKKMENC